MNKFLISIIRFFISNRLAKKIGRLVDQARLPEFLFLGENTIITQPFYSGNADRIKIGGNCHIGRNSDFGVIFNNKSQGMITIKDDVWITAGCQIYSKVGITIEENVMVAANVFICDYTHGYTNANVPYKEQPYEPEGTIRVGNGSWIGQNVVITQGVFIGSQCIIGANSVVTKSIPDKCIAVGAPAKVVKIWDTKLNTWVKP